MELMGIESADEIGSDYLNASEPQNSDVMTTF
jgi:hypothetical protein